MKVKWLSIFLLAAMPALADGPCEVRVHLSDGYGNSVSALRIRILGAKAALDVQADMPFRISDGSYTIQVTAAGFKFTELPVVIDQLEQVIAVQLQTGAVENSAMSCAIYGRITNQVGVSRVRLMELFGSRSIDVPVDVATTFDFRSIPCGNYVLMLIGPKSCLGTLMVTAGPNTGALKIAARQGKDGCEPITPER